MKRIDILFLLLIGSLAIFSSCSEEVNEITENPDPSFETGVFTDSRDGNVYSTVNIGDQTWMTENLRFRADAGCWAYKNDESLVGKYGYLYNWDVAVDTTLIPKGWHLPSDEEWDLLLDTLENLDFSVDTSFVALAKSMASAKTWNPTLSVGCPGSGDYSEFRNRSHFSAIATGVMQSDTTFAGEGYFTKWWSSTGRGNTAYSYGISNGRTNIISIKDTKSMGLNIRCVKDELTEK